MLVLLDNIVIQYFHTRQKNHHDKPSYDIHSRKVLHNFLTLFHALLFHTCDIYFATGSLDLLKNFLI